MTYYTTSKKGEESINLSKGIRTLSDGREIKLSSRAILKMKKNMVEENMKTPAHKCLWDGISLGTTSYKEEIKYNGKTYTRWI